MEKNKPKPKAPLPFELAKQIFNSLYQTIDGIGISLKEREEKNIKSKEFVYGEIEFDSFVKLLEKVKPSENDIFYDLGSGTGKPCIAIGLTYKVKKIIGYELLENLWKTSNEILNKLKNMVCESPEIKFIKGDFLEKDFSDGTIIFGHVSCLEDETMNKLEEKFKFLQPGSRIILITKKLTSSSDFELVEEGEIKMSWGIATYRIYKKI